MLFRQTATATLASIAVWLFFTIFWGMIASFWAQVLSPIRVGFPQEVLARANTELALSRLSPNTMYAEMVVGPWRTWYSSARRSGLEAAGGYAIRPWK